MAIDLLTQRQTSKDWSCSIGSDEERARPATKKIAILAAGAGAVVALGYLYWQDQRHTASIHRRLRLPTR